MVTPAENLVTFRAEFLEIVEECERFAWLCRSSRLQRESAAKLRAMLAKASEHKAAAIGYRDEPTANEMLAYECALEALANELEMYVALKADAATVAWKHLVNAQMAAGAAVRAHAAAAHLEKTYIPRLYALERLLFSKQLFMSVGFITDESECSICHAVYGECDHIKGRPYMGQFCARVVTKASVREISFVEVPADKHCRVTSITDNDGVARDPLSLEPLSDESGNEKPIDDASL
jgi:hypothetical protein